jgi:hypothetical protein
MKTFMNVIASKLLNETMTIAKVSGTFEWDDDGSDNLGNFWKESAGLTQKAINWFSGCMGRGGGAHGDMRAAMA